MENQTLSWAAEEIAFVKAEVERTGHPLTMMDIMSLIKREEMRSACQNLEAMLIKGLEGPSVVLD